MADQLSSRALAESAIPAPRRRPDIAPMRTVRIYASADWSTVELEFVYDAELVQVVRSLRQRRWHSGSRRWIVAGWELERLVAELTRVGATVDLGPARIYTHGNRRGLAHIRSPLDMLDLNTKE
jgi:hypothetical protein